MQHSYPAALYLGAALLGAVAVAPATPSPRSILPTPGPARRSRKPEPNCFGHGRPTRPNRKRTLSQASRKAKRRAA